MATTFAAKNKIAAMTMEQRVAVGFKRWLQNNPKVSREEQIQKFDEICDEVRGR